MTDLDETLGRIGLTLGEALAEHGDLSRVVGALAREQVIRQVMTETGESREIVTELLDAAHAMSEEAVLELTEGEPTTLRNALERYVDNLTKLHGEDEDLRMGDVHMDLSALLGHHWPEDGYRPVDEALGLPELPPKWSAPLSEVRIEEPADQADRGHDWQDGTCRRCQAPQRGPHDAFCFYPVEIEEHPSGALIFDVD